MGVSGQGWASAAALKRLAASRWPLAALNRPGLKIEKASAASEPLAAASSR